MIDVIDEGLSAGVFPSESLGEGSGASGKDVPAAPAAKGDTGSGTPAEDFLYQFHRPTRPAARITPQGRVVVRTHGSEIESWRLGRRPAHQSHPQ